MPAVLEPPAAGEATVAPDDATFAVFRQLLVNTLVTGVTSSFLWFALTFWVYLETRSVTTTAVIGASFSFSSAFLGPAMGTFVDRHRKELAIRAATVIALACFALATVVFVTVDADALLRLRSPWFWVLAVVTLLGSVAGQMRSIALSTTVTLLVPEDARDKANGMVGTVTGVSFAITSVFSGVVIGQLGMGWAYYLTVGFTVAALVHLLSIRIPEAEPEVALDAPTGHVDIRGALEAIRAVPGLAMLIALAAFNNLLGGVFMALMDAYGLSLVSVETWGYLFGGISLAFIVGGVFVARYGLGRYPLKILLLANLSNWIVCSLFTLHSSVVPLVVGMVVWMAMIPIIEAAEQTVLQRSIPFERQGRVFGFAQLVENAAAPVTAIAMGPLAERFFMPLMTDGAGADAIGGWFGTGSERGLALMFTIAGIIGVVVTVLALLSRSYRRLTQATTATTPALAPS